MRCMLPKSPISSTIIDTKKCACDRYAYRNALGFPVIIYQALEIHLKQFHGQLFSQSDEVAIPVPVQCTLVYNNLVKPLGIVTELEVTAEKPYQKENLQINDK